MIKPVAIIQARMGSTRLHGKVLATLSNHNPLYYIIRRCQQSKKLEGIVVATTKKLADDSIMDFANSLGINVFRGSENDVLERCIGAAIQENADPIVRITGDCPLVEPAVIDEAINLYDKTHADYVYIKDYPIGTGEVEVLSLSALERILKETTSEDIYYREHVMTYIMDHPEKFKINIQEAPVLYQRPDIRLTVDELDDLEVIRRICEHFSPRVDFSLPEIIEFLDQHPEIAALNAHVKQKTR